MFYSHEILTSRKYGVATVWLVATLGAKSNTRKVNKKAILDVDVQKACETIMQPEAPMALRLQSNLLYGVSRVYDQQCGYVLSDAQAAQLKMRELFRVVKNHDLDPSAVKARPDQLMLMDDPAFIPDMPLPPLDLDFSNLNLDLARNSQRSTQSMLSIRHRSSGSMSSHAGSLLGLDLPSSSNHTAYQLPFNDPFDGSSAHKAFGIGAPDGLGDEELMYQDDMLFEIDADGGMRDIDINEREARRTGAVFPSGLGRPESDSAASGRVRKEHEDAAAGRHVAIEGEDDFNMMHYGEDDHVLPEAEPFSHVDGGSYRPNPLLAEEEFSQIASSETAEAPAKRRKPKQKKVLQKDVATELKNGDLIEWQREYLAHMATASTTNTHKQETTCAKKNAEAWVFGNGLNGVGQGIGSFNLPSPLAIFSGASLLSKITGVPEIKNKKGTKRGSPAQEDQSSPKRARHEEDNANIFDDEVGRGYDSDIPIHDSSSGVEIGREAPSALAEYPSSALMPWNVSASLHSHRPGSSQRGRGSVVASSLNRNRHSASPLIGRGSNIPGELDNFASQIEDMVQYGRSDNDSISIGRRYSIGPGVGPSSSQVEFEIFGAAAKVDTQVAGSTQWIREALDRESGNFYEYLRNTILGNEIDELAGDDEDELATKDSGDVRNKSVTFETLFPPHRNSAMVAAQAFYHVLSLATKRRVWVEQDIEESLEPWGEIRVGVLA